jgi:hypothetical protein
MVPMGYSGALGTLIYEKNLMSKISCQTPFKLYKNYTAQEGHSGDDHANTDCHLDDDHANADCCHPGTPDLRLLQLRRLPSQSSSQDISFLP